MGKNITKTEGKTKRKQKEIRKKTAQYCKCRGLRCDLKVTEMCGTSHLLAELSTAEKCVHIRNTFQSSRIHLVTKIIRDKQIKTFIFIGNFYRVKSIVDKTILPARQVAVIDPTRDIYKNS
jgi:hypothetical protein